jgi:hypothetical protein
MKSSSKRVENLCYKKIGSTEIKVFAENQVTCDPSIVRAEFIFEINSSTKKQSEFSIFDLYKIMGIVYTALNDYIEKVIFNEIKKGSSFQLLIEAEGSDDKEIRLKDNLYEYHLKRLAEKVTCMAENVFCAHSKDNMTHCLTFSLAGPK